MRMAKTGRQSRKSDSALPKPGEAFLMPLADGRFGFCHVIGVPERVLGKRNTDKVAIETSAWIGDAVPDLNDPKLRKVLVQTHHGWGPNKWRVMVRGPAPDSFQRLGAIEPSQEQALAVFTFWETLANEVLTQWRWDHDRKALLLEEAQAVEQWKAKQAESARRKQEVLDHLDLESLRTKRRFSIWKGDRPDKAIASCRKVFREAIDGLIALGPQPKKRAVAPVIRRCVEQLNLLDEQYDGFIETGERDELCGEINEMLYVAGLRGCDGMADRWREW